MKRPRRAIPTEKEYKDLIYSVICSHCKTNLTGGIGKKIDRLFCYHCNEVIMLDWQAFKETKDE